MSYVQSQEAAGCCSADRMRRAKKAMFGLLVLAATTGLAFVIEQGGTVLILWALKEIVKASTFQELLERLMEWAAGGSILRLFFSALAAVALQILPIFNSILLAGLLGAMWGYGKGLAAAAFGVTGSAIVCFLISRYIVKHCLAQRATAAMPPLMAAVANSIASSALKSFFFVALFRLTPLIPLVWSHYLFGLTPIRILPYSLGTFCGAIPAMFAFVSAGVVGKGIADGTMSPPGGLVTLGVLATIAIFVFIGRVAHQELLKLGRDREGDEGLGELEGGGGGGRAETGKAVKELSVRGEGGRKGREDEGEEDYIPLVIGQCTGGFEDDVGATCRRPPPLTRRGQWGWSLSSRNPNLIEHEQRLIGP